MPAGNRCGGGVFNHLETKIMREAYVLAVNSLALTHALSENIRALLADCLINIFVNEFSDVATMETNTINLASRSVDTFVTFYNLNNLDEPVTLH